MECARNNEEAYFVKIFPGFKPKTEMEKCNNLQNAMTIHKMSDYQKSLMRNNAEATNCDLPNITAEVDMHSNTTQEEQLVSVDSPQDSSSIDSAVIGKKKKNNTTQDAQLVSVASSQENISLSDARTKIGTEGVRLLLEDIKCGKINEHVVGRIAYAMNGYVYGVYENKLSDRSLEPEDMMIALLDKWYRTELHQIEDGEGLEKLISILEDDLVSSDLGELVQNLKLLKRPEINECSTLETSPSHNDRMYKNHEPFEAEDEIVCWSERYAEQVLDLIEDSYPNPITLKGICG